MNAYAVVMKNGRHELAQELLNAQLAEAEWFGAGGDQRWQEQIAPLKAAIAALSQPYTLHTLCKTPECAVESVPLEGAEVFGMATIEVESEPVSGMRYRVDYGKRGPVPSGVDDTNILFLLYDALEWNWLDDDSPLDRKHEIEEAIDYVAKRLSVPTILEVAEAVIEGDRE